MSGHEDLEPTPEDELDELIAERTARNPEFPLLLEKAAARRVGQAALSEERRHGEEEKPAP